MVLEVKEDSHVARVKPLTSKRDSVALHNRGSLIMTTEEGEVLHEVEEVKVEVEELLIVAKNAISWDIDRLSVQIMKEQDTKEHI